MNQPSNKAMKLTSLSAAPGLDCTSEVDGGAASYPRRPRNRGYRLAAYRQCSTDQCGARAGTAGSVERL